MDRLQPAPLGRAALRAGRQTRQAGPPGRLTCLRGRPADLRCRLTTHERRKIMSSNTTPGEGGKRTPRRDRDNGDGALFQLKDGRWRAEVYFGFIDGKHARRATV